MKLKLALILAFLSLSALFFAPHIFALSPQGICKTGEIETGLGCIPTTTQGFVSTILTIAISLGGGIALLLILYGTFIVTTSAGIPDKLNEGQETISAAVQGLVFIIMSIVLLNLIGIKILQIPGL